VQPAIRLAVPGVTAPPSVPPDVVEGLQRRGRRFVEETWSDYEHWTPPTRALLREAGFLLSAIEAARGTTAERTAQKLLLATLAALKLEE
jgi:hypothetical protein